MYTQLDSYELMLKESVKHFIASYPIMNGGHSGVFSSFQSIFFRLIQTMPDPPLEITWFYSAVTSHASKFTSLTNPVARITLLKDLFQLLISCSNSSTGVKKIAVLAPVVYELYHIMCEFSENGLMRKEVDDLVEKIVSYVSVCYDDRENVNESDIVVICIEDLVRVWTLDKVEESCKFGDNVRVFFPVLSDEVRKGVRDRCRIEELAGMVLCEVFSLRLCLKLDLGASTEELLNNTRHCAIGTIKGFRNYYFLDMSLPSSAESYNSFLRESIDHFLSRFLQNGSDFSGFQSMFFRLVGKENTPLEIIWFYAALEFHSTKSTTQDRVLLAKNMFQLLNSCSSGGFALKQVAILAPVIYVLYHLVLESFGKDNDSLKEIESLVETIISYININCNRSLEEGEQDRDLMACFPDLVRVWTVECIGVNSDFDVFSKFFPLLTNEVRRGFNGRCSVGYLAGAVLNEIFLVRLWLKFGVRASKEELQRNMEILPAEMIKGFKTCYFLDGLFKMLLEPSLPVANLLSPENAVFLQKAVFDAVVLVDYLFLLSGGWFQSPEKLKKLALMWSLVADNAVQFARSISDESRGMSYVNAFSSSSLINQLMLWITPQANMDANLRQNISTPRALIKWLIGLKDQGLRVFDDDVLEVHAKAVVGNARMDYELPHFKQHGEIPQADEDEQRREHELNIDEEMIDSIDGASPAAVCTTTTTPSNAGRKRKEGRDDMGGAKLKLAKYNPHENIIEENHLPFSHGDAVDAGKGRRTQMWF